MEEMLKNRFFIHKINKQDSESKPPPRQLPLRAAFTFKGTILYILFVFFVSLRGL